MNDMEVTESYPATDVVGILTSPEPFSAENETPNNNMLQMCKTYMFGTSVILIGTVCLMGIIFNSLSVLILWKFSKESSSGASSLLLGSLSAADTFFLITIFIVKTVPMFVSYTGFFIEFLQAYPYFLQFGWPTVSVAHSVATWLTVLVIAHRYIAVCHPHKAAIWCSLGRTKGYILIIILCVVVYSLPLYFDKKLIKVTNGNKTSLVRVNNMLSNNDSYQLIYRTSLYYLFLYIIPVVLLAILTAFLVRALRHSKHMRKEMAPNKGNFGEKKKNSVSVETEITRLHVAVVIVYFLCQPWNPIRRILEFLYNNESTCGTHLYFFKEWASIFPIINSAANFFIFCLMGSRFRKILLTMCGCGEKPSNDGMTCSMATIASTV